MEFPLLDDISLRMCLVGPSDKYNSGKSTLAARLISNGPKVFKRPHKEVIICHEALDPIFKVLATELSDQGIIVRFVHGPPDAVVAQYEADGGATVPTLIVIDDMILRLEREGRETEKLFVWGSTKLHLDVMILVQNLYHKSMRNISIQCNIIVLMTMRRAEDQIRHLATTVTGKLNRKEVVEAYHAAINLKPMNYLVIDFRPKLDERLQFYTGLLPDEPRVYFCPD